MKSLVPKGRHYRPPHLRDNPFRWVSGSAYWALHDLMGRVDADIALLDVDYSQGDGQGELVFHLDDLRLPSPKTWAGRPTYASLRPRRAKLWRVRLRLKRQVPKLHTLPGHCHPAALKAAINLRVRLPYPDTEMRTGGPAGHLLHWFFAWGWLGVRPAVERPQPAIPFHRFVRRSR